MPVKRVWEECTLPYAIVINLDYENHPPEICSELWNVIKFGMLQAGFKCDGRRFIINLPEHSACSRARQVIDDIEDHLEYHRKHLYRFPYPCYPGGKLGRAGA